MADEVLMDANGNVLMDASGNVLLVTPNCKCCSSIGPCCARSLPCEIDQGNVGPWQFKSWVNAEVSGQRSLNRPPNKPCDGAAVSGTCLFVGNHPGLNKFGTTVINPGFEDGGCYVQRVVQNSTINLPIQQITGNLTASSSYATSSVNTGLNGNNGGWPLQPYQTPTGPRFIEFRWTFNVVSFGDDGGWYSGGVEVAVELLDGVVRRTSIADPRWRITPYLIKEGNCLLGAGATISYTYNQISCQNEDLSLTPLANTVVNVRMATMICGLAKGCSSSGTLCASQLPPGTPASAPVSVSSLAEMFA